MPCIALPSLFFFQVHLDNSFLRINVFGSSRRTRPPFPLSPRSQCVRGSDSPLLLRPEFEFPTLHIHVLYLAKLNEFNHRELSRGITPP